MGGNSDSHQDPEAAGASGVVGPVQALLAAIRNYGPRRREEPVEEPAESLCPLEPGKGGGGARRGPRLSDDEWKFPQGAHQEPTREWDRLKNKRTFLPVPTRRAWSENVASSTQEVEDGTAVAKPSSPSEHSLRLVLISDTHGKHRQVVLPEGDILIHGGDFTNTGEESQVLDLAAMFQELQGSTQERAAGGCDRGGAVEVEEKPPPPPSRAGSAGYAAPAPPPAGSAAAVPASSAGDAAAAPPPPPPPHPPRPLFRDVVCIAGNHDISLHRSYYEGMGHARFHRGKPPVDCQKVKAVLEDSCLYLEDEGATIFAPDDGEGEISVYGSPWQPEFCDWAFNVPRGPSCRAFWKKIPEGVDVLVTHGPPLGRGDLCLPAKHRAGCADLLDEVEKRVRPRLHVFGHIHESYGASFDGKTLYVNASTCTLQYAPFNPPIVVELPLDREKPATILMPSLEHWTKEDILCWVRTTGPLGNENLTALGGPDEQDDGPFAHFVPLLEFYEEPLDGNRLLEMEPREMVEEFQLPPTKERLAFFKAVTGLRAAAYRRLPRPSLAGKKDAKEEALVEAPYEVRSSKKGVHWRSALPPKGSVLEGKRKRSVDEEAGAKPKVAMEV